MERLQKVIANSGYCSRRKAEELISKGMVTVNGSVVLELGTKVGKNDVIEVDGRVIQKEEKVYFLLNKPREVVCTTSDEKNRKTVVDLIDTNVRIYPVGRLDYDTTGVLLLTNDGDFANILMHPKNSIEKVYLAKVRGKVKGEDIKKIEKGITYEGIKYTSVKVKLRKYDKIKNTSMVELTLHEGHNHEVKNIFKSLNFDVLKLTRKRVDIFEVEDLKSGQYRRLTPKEISIIYSYQK